MSAVKFALKISHFHKAHKMRNHGKEKTASPSQYKQIITVFGDIMGDLLLEKGSIRMPYSGWRFSIMKTKAPYVNRLLSKEMKEKTFSFNDHSDGFKLFFHLDTNEYDKKREAYKYIANRNLRRSKLRAVLNADPSVIGCYKTFIRKKKQLKDEVSIHTD